MSPATDKQDAFDREARTLHAAAVGQVSPQTLAALRAARHGLPAAATRNGIAWLWPIAVVGSAVLALAVGVQFLPQSTPANDTAPGVATTEIYESDYPGSLAALDESPELYLWLASAEAAPLAVETP